MKKEMKSWTQVNGVGIRTEKDISALKKTVKT